MFRASNHNLCLICVLKQAVGHSDIFNIFKASIWLHIHVQWSIIRIAMKADATLPYYRAWHWHGGREEQGSGYRAFGEFQNPLVYDQMIHYGRA